MSSLLIGFLMLCSLAMMILVLLIIFLSASLLIFARGDKKARKEVKALIEPKKSTR